MEAYKICPQCQAKLAADAGFCTGCGCDVRNVGVQNAGPAGRVCPNCGQPLRQGSNFCTACGTVISAGNSGVRAGTSSTGAPGIAGAAGTVGAAGAAAGFGQGAGGAYAGGSASQGGIPGYQAQGTRQRFAQGGNAGTQGQGAGGAYAGGFAPQGGAGYQAPGTYQTQQNGYGDGGGAEKEYWTRQFQSNPHYYDAPERSFREKFFIFKGRMSRKTYALRSILLYAINFMGNGLDKMLAKADDGFLPVVISVILCGFFVVLAVANVSVCVRRCHDRNHSGWWCMIPFYSLYLLFVKSKPGPNKYGPEPVD